MHKASRKQWFMLKLPGLMLLAAFLIGVAVEALQAEMQTASIAEAAEKIRIVSKATLQSPTQCSEEHRGPSFNSVVVVTSDEVVCSGLTSFGGSIAIHGMLVGDVVMFEGNVVINGMVNGNVTLYGGNLTLGDDAQINGDIHVCGGIWTAGSSSQLHGSAFSCTNSLGTFLAGISGASIRFWCMVAWIIFGLVLTSLLPEHIMLVRTTVKSKIARSFVLGLLSVLLTPAILAVLVGLIISIPLAILVAVGLIGAWALGTVAVGWIVGDCILRAVAPQYSTRLLQVIVGMTALTVVGSLPIIGLWINIASGLAGLGAVLLSRFGTQLYSPPSDPLLL